MKLIYTTLIFVLSLNIMAQSSLPKVINGKLVRLENFESNYVTARNVDIWLPENYSSTEKFSVLYMHDGQMLYDAEQGWNKQAWNVDDVGWKLMKSGKVNNFIVVGVWNGGVTRHKDYFPNKPFQMLSKAEKDTSRAQLKQASIGLNEKFEPISDQYLKFLVEELKPHIDANYSVHTDKNNTYVMGSSMGGLISMYALCEYPDVFGGAACLSTHWIGTFTDKNNAIPSAFLNYLELKLSNIKSNKIYFDCGDETLDAYYPNIQKRVDALMVKNGFSSKNWLSKFYSGENHSEDAWCKRVHVPLEFLLNKE